MKNKNKLTLAVCAFLQASIAVQATDSLSDAFSNGDANLSFRYRYEFVDQDGFNKDAHASTLLTRLNYKTADYNGFSFFIEADNIMEVIADSYNAGAGNSPGNTMYPVVADPQGTEINQVWFNYNFSEGNDVKVGRQRINLDNQRFIGGVAWRQNEQTFDAISGTFNLGGSQLFIAYANNVNRIFGEDVAAGDNDSNTYMLHWANDFADVGSLSVYYYDIDNLDVAAFSTTTLGAKFSGKMNDFNYGLEYASQKDAHNNAVNYSANYYRLDAGYNFGKITGFAGDEVLGGDANNAGSMFRTPLATLHAFNGWADKFLTTPQDGLEDLFIGIKGNIEGFKWQALYHNFSAEDSSRDLGTEFDVAVAKKISKKTSILLKAAFYSADAHATDTNKVWFMLSKSF